ncbi:MAG: hypothetical protein SFV81_13885 [Pirellulaceae bacterium]|nr:hypothetical protein [Pirellulaceae bacterium]
MTKLLCCTLAGICLIIGCNSQRDNAYLGTGNFLQAKDDLPAKVAEIANALERFPHDPSKDEFQSVLLMAGLNKEADGYKDTQHWWYLDANFESDSSLEKAYVVSIAYWPKRNSRLQLLGAGIHRVNSMQPGRETIWKIEYMRASLNP